jgi:hypothetical protein
MLSCVRKKKEMCSQTGTDQIVMAASSRECSPLPCACAVLILEDFLYCMSNLCFTSHMFGALQKEQNIER